MRNYRKRKRIGEAANQPRHATDGHQVQQTEDEFIHLAKEAQRKRRFRRQQETEDKAMARRVEEAQRLREFRQVQSQQETEDETVQHRAEEAQRLRKFRQVTQLETKDETIERRVEEAQRK